MVDDPSRAAADWLHRTYGGLVTLAEPEPFAEGERTWLYGCRYSPGSAGAPHEPMLASTIAVPKGGAAPFPVSNTHPLDEEFNLSAPPELGSAPWRWRVNARNCLVATDAAIDQQPVSALPWKPEDEAPGWWPRLLGRFFSDAEVGSCSSWAEVTSALLEAGEGARGVLWLRRRLGGHELTGHLLYAEHRDGQVFFLDGQRGTLADLDDAEVAELSLARFHRRPAPAGEPVTAPWESAAPDLVSAIGKATAWLDHTYAGEVVPVAPAPTDELRRGWLFACTTERFQRTGDWRDQMLDAAVVVPKEGGQEPFGLPNPDPWTWLSRWDAGDAGIPGPPEPGPAAWFAPTMQQLGPVLSATAHEHWAGVLAELTSYPAGSSAVVWVRRQDERGRESVGNLLMATRDADGVRLVDAMADDGRPELDQQPLGLHVLRFQQDPHRQEQHQQDWSEQTQPG